MRRVLWLLLGLSLAGAAAWAQSYVRGRVGVEDIHHGYGTFNRVVAGDTTVLSKWAPVNALFYGVDNTGASGASESLQVAIDALGAAGGGILYLPAGTYSIDTTITFDLTDSDIMLIGDGPATVLKQDFANFTSHMFRIDLASNLTFENLYVSGATDSTAYEDGVGGGSGHGFYVYGATPTHDITWRNVKIDSCSRDGIYIGAATGSPSVLANIVVENCDISDCNRNGVTIADGYGIRITNSAIYDNWGVGVDVEPPTSSNRAGNITISDNYIANSRVSAMGSSLNFFPRLVDVTGDNATLGIDNVVIANNSLLANAAVPDTTDSLHSVLVYAANNLGSVVFDGNVMESNRSSKASAYAMAYFRNFDALSGHGNIIQSTGATAEGLTYAEYRALGLLVVNDDPILNLDLGVLVRGNHEYAVYADSVISGRLILRQDPSDMSTYRTQLSNCGPAFVISGGTPAGQYNVMDYGAYGDGTTDDTDAIQAAIDAAGAAGGGEVYIPEGTFRFGTALTVDSDNVTIRGAGMNASILYADTTSNPSGIVIDEASHCTVRDLQVKGVVATGAGERSGIIVRGGSYNTVAYCKVDSCDDRGIALHYESDDDYSRGSFNRAIYNIVSRTTEGTAIEVMRSDSCIVQGNMIDDLLYSGDCHGIRVAGCTQTLVSDNVVNANNANAKGITVQGYSGASVDTVWSTGVLVTNNVIGGVFAEGLLSQSRNERVSFVDNMVHLSNVGRPLRVYGSASGDWGPKWRDIRAQGNQLYGGSVGIDVRDDGERLFLVGNFITNYDTTGIQIVEDSGDTINIVMVDGNVMQDTSATGAGIYVESGIDSSVYVQDNAIFYTAGSAVAAGGATVARIDSVTW